MSSAQVSAGSPVIHIDRLIGMKAFGACASQELPRKVGFEPERLAATAKQRLGRP